MLKTSVERLEGSVVKLTVTVPAEDVDQFIDGTYKELAKKYRIPGFRPGKTPKPILDQKLGREYVLGEATESAVNNTYPKALDAEGLRPIESPELADLESVAPGEDYTYTADVVVRPELTLSSTEGLAIEMPSGSATQDEIDMQLEIVRERFATLEPVEDRGVEPDDYVLLSFVGTVEGEPFEGNEVDKYLYEMGRGLMPAPFEQGILGAKPGESREIEFEIPETTSNAEFAGKMSHFAVDVHEIKAKVLPAIDDEFATNMGGFDSAEQMIADLTARIEMQKRDELEQLRERRLRAAVVERLVGDIPEAMIVNRREQMMRDFLAMLESREMTVPQYLAASGIDMDRLDEDIKGQAETSVREELALEALFRAQGMEVTEEDIDAEMAEVAEASNTPIEDARKRWIDLGLMPIMREQIMQRKATGWLLENVTVTEEAATPASATDDSADEAKGTKKSASSKGTSRSKKKSEDETEAAAEGATEKTEE